MYGWMGKILQINLNDSSSRVISPSGSTLRQFLGGRGLSVKLLCEKISAQVDPYSPQNLIVIAAGPLTATDVPTTGRMVVATKSPLTGTVFDSNAGGHLGPELKGTGYDAVIISGKLPELSRIIIGEEGVEIERCPELSGRGVYTTFRSLEEQEGRGQHMIIGPAGENKVRFASISIDGSRTLGRGGLGAVLGSKNIKAVSFRGNKKPEVANKQEVREVKNKSAAWLNDSSLTSERLNELGTAMLMNLINEAGALPSYNFQSTRFARADQISGEKLAEKVSSSGGSCYNCPIACSRKIAGSSGEQSSPEYESLGLLGANLGLDDPELVTDLNDLCDDLGLDTISTGSVLACLMEMGEKEILDCDLSFGSSEGVKELIKKIARREDLGDEMAEGSLRFARSYDIPELAMQVKGLDIPAFDPRGLKGQALGYMTSNRGACHLRANMITYELLGFPEQVDRFSEEEKAPLVSHQQDLNAILDSLIVCKFTLFALAEGFYRDMLEAVTGQSLSEREFFQIGERIWNLERIFNLAAGFRREHDTLPERFKKEKGSGPANDSVVVEEKMLSEYYEVRGWNQEGIPRRKKLRQLNLEEFHHMLPEVGRR